jgi:hypothetical protein
VQAYVVNNLQASSRLFVINTWFKGQSLATLLDDGSMINIISPATVQHLGLIATSAHTISIRQFQSVEVSTCNMQVHLSLNISNASSKGKQKLDVLCFWVCDLGASFDCLVGMPAHVSMDVCKIYRTRRVSFTLASGNMVSTWCTDKEASLNIINKEYNSNKVIAEPITTEGVQCMHTMGCAFDEFVVHVQHTGILVGGVVQSDSPFGTPFTRWVPTCQHHNAHT